MISTALHIHEEPLITYRQAQRYDPTRTTVLRNIFSKQMDRRFDKLARDIRHAVVDLDVFGLKDVTTHADPATKAFDFTRSSDKVKAFMQWLQQMIDEGILEVTKYSALGTPIEIAWTDMYISDSYKRGILRANYELRAAGYDVPIVQGAINLEAGLTGPFHLDRVGLIATRVFEDLRGITSEMSTQIMRILAQGMADGDGPRDLARKIVYAINGKDRKAEDRLGLEISYINPRTGKPVTYFMPGRRRAEILARTEVIRAHHVATIQEYRNWGVEGVEVQAEWKTAGDARVCDDCASLEGKIFTLDEIEPMIPRHPQCRCLALPAKPRVIPLHERRMKYASM